MSSPLICTRIEPDLRKRLDSYAKTKNMSKAQAVRVLLRHALGVPPQVSLKNEAYFATLADVRKKITKSLT